MLTEEEVVRLIDHFWDNVVTGIEKTVTLTTKEAQFLVEAMEEYRLNYF